MKATVIEASQGFPRFPDLPLELRLQIWRYCLPCRIVELDTPVAPRFKHDHKISRANTSWPCLVGVCREAREVAFESGGIECHPITYADEKHPNDRGDLPREPHRMVWIDRRQDCFYLDYTGPEDVLDEVYPDSDRFLYAIHHASHSKDSAPAISDWTIRSYESRCYDDPDARPYEWKCTRREFANILLRAPAWRVVIMSPVYVFCDKSKTDGLFGVLGDAPVQLVNVNDETKLDAYRSLGNVKGVKVLPGFDLKVVRHRRNELCKGWKRVFDTHGRSPVLDIVIMFRLYSDSISQEDLEFFEHRTSGLNAWLAYDGTQDDPDRGAISPGFRTGLPDGGPIFPFIGRSPPGFNDNNRL
ncbi:Hypothetical protein D9617_12g036590 [Elsinoe fawcettii]|nr:Hypothetical protein D9617_12g036590 [Elsinoe fawcettii]